MSSVEMPEIVRRVLDGYREKLCPKDWRLLPFDCERRGPEIILTVRDETFAPREVRGRLSGFMLLAGRYFGACLDDVTYAREPVFLRYPGRAGWVEEAAAEALTKAAIILDEAGELEEAAFVLRRGALGCEYRGFEGRTVVRSLPEGIPDTLRQAALRTPGIVALLAGMAPRWTKAMSIAAEAFAHADPLERAAALSAAIHFIAEGEWHRGPRICRELAEIALPGLVVCTGDENPFVQELALAALEALSKHLYVIQDFEHLGTAVEPLLSAGVYPAWQLERRYAVRLWRGDEAGAKRDLEARYALDEGRPPEAIIVDLLEKTTRIAEQTLAQPGTATALDRIERVLDSIAKDVESRAEALIEARKKSHEAPLPREPYRAYFAARSMLAEQRGDIDRAIAMLERGRAYAAAGHEFRTEEHLKGLNALRRKKLGIARPDDFDPEWLTSSSVSEEEARAALDRWRRIRWRDRPRNGTEALGTPAAGVLVVSFDVARTWSRRPELDLLRLQNLHRKLAPIALEAPPRALVAWSRALGVTTSSVQDRSPEQWQAFDAFLARLEGIPPSGPGGTVEDETAVLEAIAAPQFEAMAARLEAAGPRLDLVRWFCERMDEATRNALLTARWVRMVREVWRTSGNTPTRPIERFLRGLAGGGPASALVFWEFVEAWIDFGDDMDLRYTSRPLPWIFWPLAFVWDESLIPRIEHRMGAWLAEPDRDGMERRAMQRAVSFARERNGSTGLAKIEAMMIKKRRR